MNVLKKVRNVVVLFAMALVIVGLAKSEKALAASSYEVNYEEGIINVSVPSGSVYFTVVKEDGAQTDVSNSKFSEATPDGSDFIIDMSTFKTASTVYVAFVTALDADGKTTVPAENIITLAPAIKKLAVTLDYTAEDVSSLEEFLNTVTVTDSEGTVTVYTKNSYGKYYDADENRFYVDSFIQTRTTAGEWDFGFDAFSSYAYLESYKVSGATLYMRYFDQDNVSPYSKEIKVKVSKVSKAPNVKITYKKDTVALKNGMQISATGKTDTWESIYAYDKTSTNTNPIGDPAGVSGSALTSTKVTYLTTNQIVDILGLTADSNGDYTFYVRTAATAKKYASAKTKVTFTPSAAAPAEITAAAVSGGYLTVTFTSDLTNYEYTVVKASDIGIVSSSGSAFTVDIDYTGDTVFDIVKSKWTSLKTTESKLLIASTKYCPAYYNLYSTSEFKTTLISDATYVLLRAKGGTNDAADNLPSQIYAFPIN